MVKMRCIWIDAKKCDGCGICVGVCLKGLLHFDESVTREDGTHPVTITRFNKCMACANCAHHCPHGAIEVFK